jgi:argininosuccinate lyase
VSDDKNLDSVSTVGGRLKAGPGGSYAEFIQAPRFEADRVEKFAAIILTHKAWTVMLTEQGLISKEEARLVIKGLFDLQAKGHEALGQYQPDLEDLYMHVERFLSAQAGADAVGKINYGRTRPEPFNRLVGRQKILVFLDELISFYAKMLGKAEDHLEMIMPGYTHMQQAQPMTVAHYLLAVADLTARAIQGMELAYGFMNRNSLGTGALAGTHGDINRQRISELMGFPELVENAYDAVAAADHFSVAASMAAGLAANLSRIAQDFSIWSMAEIDFAYVGDEFAATSSMMPQKRNSVCWEFIRARAAKVVGASMDVLTIIHNITFADVCDTCIEVAEPTWRALDTAAGTVRLLGDAITSVRFNGKKMLNLVASGFSSVSELAVLIQRKSAQPYRVVHRLIGQIVGTMIEEGKTAREIDSRIVAFVAKRMGFPPVELNDAEVRKALDPWEFISAHGSPGGTAPKEGRRMLVERVRRLEAMGKAQKERHRLIKEAEDKLDEILHSLLRKGKER